MRLSSALLVSAVAASASCATKAGQIAVIGPLTDAWKLYNQQVAFNAEVDEKIANVTNERDARDIVIINRHTGYAEKVQGDADASMAATAGEHATAQTALTGKHDDAQIAIEATYQAALTAAQNRATVRLAETNVAIAAIQQRGVDSENADVLLGEEVEFTAVTRRSDAVLAAGVKTDAINTEEGEKLAHADTHDAAVRVRYAAKLVSQIDALNAKFTNIHDDIESTKYDLAATLGHLDTAGHGGVEYASNCIVSVEDAVAMVKDEKSPNQIWHDVVIGDGGSSARDATPEPTNEPTKSPTPSPTPWYLADDVDPDLDPDMDPDDTLEPTPHPTPHPTMPPTTKSPTPAPAPTYNPNIPDWVDCFSVDCDDPVWDMCDDPDFDCESFAFEIVYGY